MAAAQLAATRVTKTDSRQIRVFQGNMPSPAELTTELLHDQPGLVAWFGKRDEEGRVRDVLPFFTARENGNELSAVTCGVVLLTDIVRDLAPENRRAVGNFALGTADQMGAHIRATYGDVTFDYINHQLLGRKLKSEDAHFLAARLARVLRVNYLDAAKAIRLDGSRVRLELPPTTLTNLKAGSVFTSYKALIVWLGEHWLEAESQLLLKRPGLSDRSKYYAPPEEPAA